MQSHRRIDIDLYDEERLTAEDLVPADVQARGTVNDGELRGKVTESRSALQRGDLVSALSLILADPPYGQAPATKQLALSTVLTALQSCRQTEIQGILAKLPPQQVDVLTKYVYRGMALVGEALPGSGWEEVNTAVLLGWHEKLVESAGPGTIMRTMTDRRTV